MRMTEWAENISRAILQTALPRRWAHTRQVAAVAERLRPVLREDTDLLTAAAWLHDIGYGPALASVGYHPLDGARYLRDVERADGMLCRLVAHHSCAVIEAEERGVAAELIAEFEPAPPYLADALIYCDMASGPDGQPMTVAERLAEITNRYGPADVVSRAIARSAPLLTAAAGRVRQRIAEHDAGHEPGCPGKVLAAAVC